jgi:hypothetical protein
MSWQDKVAVIFGALSIAMGLAFFLSPRFGEIAFTLTSQGVLWKQLFGERWAPVAAKFFLSLASIAFGAFVIYSAITGT